MNVLEDEQVQGLLLSLAEVRGAKGFSENDAELVIKWATSAMVEFSLFQGIMNGDMYVDVNEKHECVFGITDQGAQMARTLALRGGSTKIQ